MEMARQLGECAAAEAMKDCRKEIKGIETKTKNNFGNRAT